MTMSFFMFLMWQTQGQAYKNAFDSSSLAYYEGSEFKLLSQQFTDVFKKDYPLLAKTLPIAYSVGMNKEMKFVSTKISLVPEAMTAYQYNHTTRSGSIGLTWSF